MTYKLVDFKEKCIKVNVGIETDLLVVMLLMPSLNDYMIAALITHLFTYLN